MVKKVWLQPAAEMSQWIFQALRQIGRAPPVKTHIDSMTSQTLVRLPGESPSNRYFPIRLTTLQNKITLEIKGALQSIKNLT